MAAESHSEFQQDSHGYGLNRKTKDRITIIVFLLPSLILFSVFVIYPIFRSVYFSLFDWNGLGPATDFIALDNYKRILSDKIFQKAVVNNLIIAGLSLLVQLPLSLGIAIMVGKDFPGRGLFRTIFFLPYVLSEVVTAIIFLGLFNPNPDRGFINAILVWLGMEAQPFLGDPGLVLFSIFIVLSWKYFGLHMLLFMAGLQNIPHEIEEAAIIDGANQMQLLTQITIPLLGSTIRTSAYLSVLGSLTQFTLIWVMTKGGPINASEVMATYMYRYGFVRFWLGYGSAVAIVMLLIALIFSLVYRNLLQRRDYLAEV
jgi:raffinose/stachyose/melibiose transport system permease protein